MPKPRSESITPPVVDRYASASTQTDAGVLCLGTRGDAVDFNAERIFLALGLALILAIHYHLQEGQRILTVNFLMKSECRN